MIPMDDPIKDKDAALAEMIADYMEKGFLENIIDMYKHDSGLYRLIGILIQDERVRVRLGVTALMEDLSRSDRNNIGKSLPFILPPLSSYRWNLKNLFASAPYGRTGKIQG